MSYVVSLLFFVVFATPFFSYAEVVFYKPHHNGKIYGVNASDFQRFFGRRYSDKLIVKKEIRGVVNTGASIRNARVKKPGFAYEQLLIAVRANHAMGGWKDIDHLSRVLYLSGYRVEEVNSKVKAPTYITPVASALGGLGLFAKEVIKAGSYIGLYTGEISWQSAVPSVNFTRHSIKYHPFYMDEHQWLTSHYPAFQDKYIELSLNSEGAVSYEANPLIRLMDYYPEKCLVVNSSRLCNETAFIQLGTQQQINCRARMTLLGGVFCTVIEATRDIPKNGQIFGAFPASTDYDHF